MRDDMLQQQVAYYQARAGEYDEWFLRQGRFDHGPADNAAWFVEAAEVRAALHATGQVESALELACGTGIWTRELAHLAQHVTALDAAPEMLAINARAVNAAHVQRAQVDLFAWEPMAQYDLVFFGFWLSHVPRHRMASFLATAARAVRPGGRLFLIDSRPDPQSSAVDHVLPDPGGDTHQRKLNDGSTFTIVKVFYTPEEIAAVLHDLGFVAEGHQTARFFVWATGIKHVARG
jgi:SAM-dependent methyltransferase